MKWISVKERLPEIKINKSLEINESEKVLALLENGQIYKMELTHWYENDDNDFNWIFDDTGEFCETVTHWMPLPEPPTK